MSELFRRCAAVSIVGVVVVVDDVAAAADFLSTFWSWVRFDVTVGVVDVVVETSVGGWSRCTPHFLDTTDIFLSGPYRSSLLSLSLSLVYLIYDCNYFIRSGSD